MDTNDKEYPANEELIQNISRKFQELTKEYQTFQKRINEKSREMIKELVASAKGDTVKMQTGMVKIKSYIDLEIQKEKIRLGKKVEAEIQEEKERLNLNKKPE